MPTRIIAPMLRKLRTSDWFHPDGFPLAVERRDPQEPFGPHTHEFSELVIVTGGRALHVTGRESWPIGTGDVFVIGGPRAHEYRDMQTLRLINILFRPENLRLKLWDMPALPGYHALFTIEPALRQQRRFGSRLRLDPKELGIVTGYVDTLDHELQARTPGFAFAASALFMQIVAFLSRCYSRSRSPDARAVLRIASAISHIEAHFDQPLDLDALAKLAHMSKRSFLRAFQSAVGSAPIAYLINLRLSRAATLLRRSDEDITSAAFKSGFNDSNYFARQFRKTFGLSPREYRKREADGNATVRSDSPRP